MSLSAWCGAVLACEPCGCQQGGSPARQGRACSFKPSLIFRPGDSGCLLFALGPQRQWPAGDRPEGAGQAWGESREGRALPYSLLLRRRSDRGLLLPSYCQGPQQGPGAGSWQVLGEDSSTKAHGVAARAWRSPGQGGVPCLWPSPKRGGSAFFLLVPDLCTLFCYKKKSSGQKRHENYRPQDEK